MHFDQFNLVFKHYFIDYLFKFTKIYLCNMTLALVIFIWWFRKYVKIYHFRLSYRACLYVLRSVWPLEEYLHSRFYFRTYMYSCYYLVNCWNFCSYACILTRQSILKSFLYAFFLSKHSKYQLFLYALSNFDWVNNQFHKNKRFLSLNHGTWKLKTRYQTGL